MKTYRYTIRGRVQGVAFRYYTWKSAHRYSINGTVENLFNGDVEVYAQGAPGDILKFEGFLHQGPAFARVEKVTREELEMDRLFHGFEIV